MSVHEIVLYRGEKHEVLFIYDSKYIEIKEIDSLRKTVKLVHQSEVRPLNCMKKTTIKKWAERPKKKENETE